MVTLICNLGKIDPVEEGNWYQFCFDISTRAGHIHAKMSYLYVVRRTLATPHDEISESGVNWVCQTEFGESVWATLEQCLSRKVIAKCEPFWSSLMTKAKMFPSYNRV